MLSRFSKYYLLSYCLLLFSTLKSQYDTTHYIPYLADLTGATKMANLEYQSVFNGAYFMFSTFEAGSTNVKVYKRNASGSGWDSSPILTRNISPGSPYTWSPGNSKVQEFFRYAKYKKKKPKVDLRYNQSWLKTGHYGLKIVATRNIYVRTVLQPDAKDGGSTEYGNGTNTHGAAFSSKGVTRGAGVEFYSAHFYTENKVSQSGDQDFISVMSLENGNNVVLNSTKSWYTLTGLASNKTITLNEGESAIFKRSWSGNNNSIGTRVFSSNDKEMVVTSGSWGGKLRDASTNAQDIGIEQLVPVKALGKKYLMSQSKTILANTSPYRQGIVVVAVEEGTTSYTFNGTSYTLNRGERRFHYIPGFTTNTTGGPYAVISDKKLLAIHQILANPGSAKTNQFGMTILGPIYNSYTSPGYNKISLGGGYYEHALWDDSNEDLAIYYMTNASDAELNSLANGKVKFQGSSLNPITSFISAGSKTIDGETWKIRYREVRNPHNNFTNESFFDFSTIDKPVYVWWQVGFKLQGNISSISPYQVGGCDVPTITQQPSITPNNANEGTNSQLRVTTSPSSGVSYTWQISPDGNSWENLSSGAVSGTTFSSPTAATVNLTGLSLDLDDYQFRVIVENATDASCVVTSTAVTLNVNCTNPTITGQPSDVSVAPGTATSFIVTGTHANGVTYKWYLSTDGGSSFNPINTLSGSQQTYSISNPSLSNDGWKFKARVSNSKDTSCYVESNVATLNVAAANDCPVYNPITLAPGLKEDRDDIVINLNSFVTDADSDTVSFTNISSNNITLVAATLSGTASLVLSFEENQSGSAQISFDYTDENSGCDNTATFNVNIQPVNDCPTVNTSLSDISATWNSNDQTIALNTLFNDVDTINLTYTVTNTNDSIVSTTISGTDLIIDYLENQSGTVTVTVGVNQTGSVSNGSSLAACTVSDTFVITVIKPNQEPSFTKGPNITLCENSGAYTATGWATNIDDGDSGTQNVSFDIFYNSNPGIFDVQPQISATGALTFTLKANRSGNVTLLARIEDDGGTANGGDNQSDPQTFFITVNQEDNPDFNFSVSGSTITEICEDDSRSIDLIVSGTSTQGTFTVSPSGIMSFNYVTPSSYNFTVNSTGTATITFTTNGTCPGTVTKTITLSAAEDSSFSYTAATFCASDSDPSATLTTSGGTFSSSAGLVFTDTSSGTIDLDGSTPGSYTVTYTTSGLCATATSTLITIESDDMSFTYDSSGYSQSCPNPTPTITGITSGTFSSSASLTIDVNTGEITTSTSSPGTYTVTYSLYIPTTNTTSWTKALDFSGGSEYVEQVSNSMNYQPLQMGGLANIVSAPSSQGRTSSSSSSRPWATAIVFKSDGKNSTQHIWNQGEGSTDGDDNIFLKVDAQNQLQLVWGRSGGPLNQCRIEASISTNTWYGVYIAHNGVRLSSSDATASNLANAFDIRVMSSADSFSSLSANKSTSSNWKSTGASMTNAVTGTFTIGGRGNNRNFDGKIASMVVHCLKLGVAMPDATEIKLIITDPTKWETDYLLGKSYRQPTYSSNSTNYQKPTSAGFASTQMWIMGDGVNDGSIVVAPFPNIRNNQRPILYSYTSMDMFNMVSDDIETVNINGLTSIQPSCATPASFEVTITAALNADFSYPSTPYCSSSANVTPTITGQSGGSFTVPTGLSLVSSSTGEIDISASTPGSYTVSYTVSECGSSITATTTLEITASVTATVVYGAATYSDNDADPTPTITGHVTGTFTASPTGLSFTSTSTGEIDLSASTLGTYEITFTPSATCSIPVTTTLKIQGCPYVENPIGYPLTIPTSQIAFYEFEGNGDDSEGSYDLTITGAATYENQQSQGVSSTFKGQSILFEQAGHYASVDFSQAFSSASGLTVSTWIKIKDINPGFLGSGYNYVDLVWWANANSIGGINAKPMLRTFIGLNQSTSSRTIRLNGDVTGLSNDLRISNDEEAINNTLLDTENKWHNLAYTIDFDNQEARLYIDGELYGNAKFTGNYSTTDFLFFGDYTGPNNDYMYDEMRVFDSALTSKEIRNIAHTSQHQRSTTATPQTDPTFDLSNVFADPNSNDTLTYTASVTYQSEAGLATVSISSSTLTVDINDASEGGNAVIEVTASDGTCSSTHTFNLIVLPDKDQDGIADEDDLDDDNDGILDTVEGTDTDGDGIPDDDADGDGVPNHLDTDSDNDGCLDSEEAGYFLGTSSIVVDAQGRRINDNQGPITIGTDAYTASNTLLDINGNSVRDYIEDGPTIALTYAESYYCTSGTDPTPTLNFTVSGTISGTISPTGTFTASPSGLVFSNSSSGTIDLSASVSNTYIITFNSTLGGCPSTVTTTLQIIGQDDPTFSYDSATYCLNDSNPTPTITTPGGAFSSSASLTLNTVTGEITTSTSSPGTYTVTYTTAGTCTDTSSVEVTIYALDDASFSYPRLSYCVSDTDPIPTLTASQTLIGGTFTAGSGLTFTSSSTGIIDLSSSTAGSYTVTFTTAGNCPQSSSVNIRINDLDDASFSYNKAAYCINESDPSAIITGTTLGKFTSPPGLVFTNTYSGTIDLDASIPGTYTVTYTTPEIIQDGLVLYLDTENPNSYSGSGNTWYDLSGNDNDFTLFGSPSFDANVNGGVINFDNVDDKAEIDNLISRSQYTKLAFFFPRSKGDKNNIVSGVGGNGHALYMKGSDNEIFAGHGNVSFSTISYQPNGGGSILDGWHFSAVSFSNIDGWKMYYNGQQVATDSRNAEFTSASTGVKIGSHNNGNWFDGYIPVVLIYDRVLNADEIKVNYNYFAERYGLTKLGDIGGFCQNTSSFEITINGLDNADFTYDSSTYCEGGTDPTPTITGLSGGTFSSTASLSLSTASGTIDLSASSPGSYTVTYTTAGSCTNTSSFDITIVAQDDGTFSYGSLLYCKGDTNPTPTITEYTAGTFVSTAGLSFVSSSTGEINLSASVSGTYTVSYTTGGTCTVTTSQIIQIADKDDASFSYPRASFTLNCDNPTPTITGLSGGVWEAPPGLTINPATGEINLSASASGTYTVSYTVENLCRNTATTTIVLSPADDPYFSYSKYSYCVNESDPTPLSIATVSGTFSGSASITVNATTGAIDISTSSVGDHVITYTTSSTCPSTSSRTITITPLEDATFTFSSGSYCKGSSNVSPTIATPGGTFTSPANLYMNASTGLINIALSTPGTYTVTYTTAGTCTNTSTGTITINALDDASFSYAKSNYCSNDSDPSATISGLTGGTFSSAAGLVFTNTSSGTIDLDGSTPGTYTVTYTTSGTCTNTAGFELTITAQDSATISYGSATYCPLESDPTPTITGYATGTYSSTTGLVINTATGAIDVSASTSGTYTVSYTTQGSCPITVTTTVQIIECPDTDGDGVPDITENIDGTNPNDTCDYVVNSQDASKTTNAWKNADCDGDGVTNTQEIIDETDPNDVCSYKPTSQVINNVAAAWNNADCDGDGITNEKENTDGTDEFDSCSGVNASVTLPITTTTDCDGDGSIGDDPDNLSPGGACVWGTQNIGLTTPFWRGLDCDGDGVTNGNEVNDGTNPQNACDYTYSSISLTVSATNDCDGDGVGNDQEALDGTDPDDVCSYISSSVSLTLVTGTWNSADCDGDGVTNGKEVTDGTDWANVCSFTFASQTVSPSSNWNAADCDGDGVTNGQEITDGTDPTDGCSYTASNISLNQSTAWRDLDCDQDGVTNGQELTDGTDPKDTCSYNASNQVIVNVGATWNAADCDGDSVTNGQEVIDGTSPTDTCSYTTSRLNVASTTATWQNADCDQDGVPNSQENTDGTDPKDTCDYDVNNQVLANVGATWNAADCDADGVTNGQEVIDNTGTSSPCDFITENITGSVSATLDCDGDSVPNAQELIDGTDPKSSCDYLIANFNVASVTATWDALDCDGDGVINGTEKGSTDYHDDCSFTTASITVSVTSTSDCDGDGVTNAQEDIDNTDPKDECSFVDGSITIVPTTPKDCDGDGVLDNDEEIDGTDANDICDFVFASQSTSTIALWATLDCDGDGVTNGDEITDGTNPKEVCSYLSTSVSSTLVSETWNLADCDGDGVTNGDESDDFTDPLDPCYFDFDLQTVSPTTVWNNLDCDGDGVTNGDELTDNSNPLFSCDFIVESITVTVTSNLDCDADGVSNANEYLDDTDPLDPCEVNPLSIDRIATAIKDCDQDGVDDETELLNGTDPTDACSYNVEDITMEVTTDVDCDGDGVPNSIEIEIDDTDPNDNCDFNPDNIVLDNASLAWKNADCDGDGVPNGQEITDGTDPKDLCSNVIANQTLTPSAEWNAADCNNDGYCNACSIPEPSTGGGGGGRTRTPNNDSSTSTPTIDDLDGDGIEDSLDDDDDGDGIPDDQDEFPRDGTEWDDLDGDGVGDNKDVDDDNDGINDALESPNGNEDFDGDGIPNYLDLDSDNDGCPDVIEAGYIDQDGDFILSDTDGIEFNEIGQVISDSGYSYPADSDNNGILDFLEEGSQVEIIVNPASRAAILSGRNIILQVEATSLGSINYQWQVNKSGPTAKGIQWQNIDNGSLYLGTKSDKLIIRNANSNMDGWSYRVIAFSPCYVCGDVVESEPTELYFTPLSIPKGFSPNGDGFNDTWVIDGLENYIRNKLTIYNRWETKVYEKVNYNNDWDGSSYISGFGGTNTLPDGIYFYILELDNEKPITGYIYLKNQ